jgi:hypothetical protein
MRPITVTVGPVGSTAANNIAASQTPAGAGSAVSTTVTAGSASIAATQSFALNQAVQFYGPMNSVTGLVQYQTYYVSTTGASSFQVSNTPGGSAVVPGGTGTGTPNVATTNQVTLNGSLATSAKGVTTVPLSSPQRVLITTADTTHTFTITGLTPAGARVSETLGPVTSTATSTLDYSTITNITVSGALTAAVTVGTNGVASTPWVRLDEWANTQVAIQCDVTGTVNYTVQSTLDDPNSNFTAAVVLPSAVNWIATNDTAAVGATASLQTNFAFAPVYARVLLNSGSGSVNATFSQSNVANR